MSDVSLALEIKNWACNQINISGNFNICDLDDQWTFMKMTAVNYSSSYEWRNWRGIIIFMF